MWIAGDWLDFKAEREKSREDQWRARHPILWRVRNFIYWIGWWHQ